MPKAAKVGDIATDHDGFAPTAVTSGSPDVFIDHQPAARVGDPVAPHAKPNHPPHGRTIAIGNPNILVNGLPLAETGSSVSCGGVVVGSGTVTAGYDNGLSVGPGVTMGNGVSMSGSNQLCEVIDGNARALSPLDILELTKPEWLQIIEPVRQALKSRGMAPPHAYTEEDAQQKGLDSSSVNQKDKEFYTFVPLMAEYPEVDYTSTFSFRKPKGNDHVAGDGENIIHSIVTFFAGAKGDWIFPNGHQVSERFKKHVAVLSYIKAFESASGWAKASARPYLLQKIKKQHTTYKEDFYNDVKTILGAWGEGAEYHDYGTNSFGSLSVKGELIFDKSKNKKILRIEIYNRWSIGSLTRNPFTRKAIFTKGIEPVNVYVQIEMEGNLIE